VPALNLNRCQSQAPAEQPSWPTKRSERPRGLAIVVAIDFHYSALSGLSCYQTRELKITESVELTYTDDLLKKVLLYIKNKGVNIRANSTPLGTVLGTQISKYLKEQITNK